MTVFGSGNFREFVTPLLEGEGKLVYLWKKYGEQMMARAGRDYTSPLNSMIGLQNPLEEKGPYNLFSSMMSRADPTAPHFKYAEWILKIYLYIWYPIWEDMVSTISSELETFHKAKLRGLVPPLYKDINHFSPDKLSKFYSVVKTLRGTMEEKDVEDTRPKARAESAQKVAHGWKMIIPHTEVASCYYGRGTRWCTSANRNNMFRLYKNSGTLVICIPEHPQHKGEKYQIHFPNDNASIQIADENDRVERPTITPNTIFSDKKFRRALHSFGLYKQWDTRYDEFIKQWFNLGLFSEIDPKQLAPYRWFMIRSWIRTMKSFNTQVRVSSRAGVPTVMATMTVINRMLKKMELSEIVRGLSYSPPSRSIGSFRNDIFITLGNGNASIEFNVKLWRKWSGKWSRLPDETG